MSRKLVAIGGGENGRINRKGEKLPYETKEIDEEIVKLCEKEHPNFLFLGHAQIDESYERGYYETIKAIYGDMLGCACKTVKKAELKTNIMYAKELIEWADIIYEGGGDTKGMIELWRETGFDKMLKQAWEEGKVICGVSAGANCWFGSCSSAALKMQLKDMNAPMINVECLGFVDAFFTPHCNVANEHINRLKHMKESLKGTNMIGLGLSNCCAIEIVDSKYRLLTTNASNYGIEAYGIKTYWKRDEYIEEFIEVSNEFKNLSELLS